jgi:hypothetical protein
MKICFFSDNNETQETFCFVLFLFCFGLVWFGWCCSLRFSSQNFYFCLQLLDFPKKRGDKIKIVQDSISLFAIATEILNRKTFQPFRLVGWGKKKFGLKSETLLYLSYRETEWVVLVALWKESEVDRERNFSEAVGFFFAFGEENFNPRSMR